MGILNMSKDEREAFLAEVHVGVLAVERPDAPPLVTPVWYRYEPGGVIEFTTSGKSVKAQLLRASGRATLCAQREDLPYAYVTVEGTVTIGEAITELRAEIATRYLGAELGTAYLEGSPDLDNVLVQLAPERWRTTDYTKLDLGA